MKEIKWKMECKEERRKNIPQQTIHPDSFGCVSEVFFSFRYGCFCCCCCCRWFGAVAFTDFLFFFRREEKTHWAYEAGRQAGRQVLVRQCTQKKIDVHSNGVCVYFYSKIRIRLVRYKCTYKRIGKSWLWEHYTYATAATHGHQPNNK